MPDTDVHGPIDYVLLEFPADRLTGRAAEEMLDLHDRGIVRLYDVMLLGKTADGQVFTVDLAQETGEPLGGFEALAWATTGLLSDEDRELAASALEPNTMAALIVFENTWAVPFVAAAREAGGELVAGARIPAQDVMDALASLEGAETMETTS
jgi:hypothetical protein